jgi:hypothetical protein
MREDHSRYQANMFIPADRFSRDVLASLPDIDREQRLQELELFVNPALRSQRTLSEFQEQLYVIIKQLESIGHSLGRWEHDCEVEYWGGKSYMDKSVQDELLLRAEYLHGIRLAWRNYESLHTPLA